MSLLLAVSTLGTKVALGINRCSIKVTPFSCNALSLVRMFSQAYRPFEICLMIDALFACSRGSNKSKCRFVVSGQVDNQITYQLRTSCGIGGPWLSIKDFNLIKRSLETLGLKSKLSRSFSATKIQIIMTLRRWGINLI